MNIIFDYQVFFLQKYGGISRYFYELACELNKLPDCNALIAAPVHNNEYLAAHSAENFIYKPGSIVRKIVSSVSEERKLKINEFVARRNLRRPQSLLHETYYTHRFHVKRKKVITIHDMIPEIYNGGSEGEKQLILGKRSAIETADLIIAVSHNTKKELLQFYPQASGKTFVVHHGVTHQRPADIESYQHKRPYILFVGHRGGYKNFETLLQVYCSDKNIFDSVDLIAFGGYAEAENERALIEKYKLRENIFFISGNDKLLNSLYKGALCLVYNSRHEGFGMPVLEAMQLGCPVICSNTTSLPEVSGDAALTIDPASLPAFSDALNKIIYDGGLRDDLNKKGQVQAAKFSWEKCASETHTLYNNLLHG